MNHTIPAVAFTLIVAVLFMVHPAFDECRRARRVVNWLGVVLTGALGVLLLPVLAHEWTAGHYLRAGWSAVSAVFLLNLSYSHCVYRGWRV